MTETSDDRKLLGIAKWRWEIVNQVVSLFGVVGLLFGIYQYSQSLEATRAEKTLTLIDRWAQDGYRDHFLSLSDRIAEGISGLTVDDRQAIKDGKIELDHVYTRVAQFVMSEETSQQNFDNVVYYLNLLGLCVKANLCSTNTAEIFFDDTVMSFLTYFGDEISNRRTAIPRYGEGALYLGEKFR